MAETQKGDMNTHTNTPINGLPINGLLTMYTVRASHAATRLAALQQGYNEWGLKNWEALRQERGHAHDNARVMHTDPQLINDGSLMTIFNTIADGTTCWEGTISLEFNSRRRPLPFNPRESGQGVFGHCVRGLQSDCPAEDWAIMFIQSLPAILTRNGKSIHGALEPFFETGTEGVIWALHEYGTEGYNGLNILEDGDDLRVYDTVTDGNIEWQGRVSFETYDAPREIDVSRQTPALAQRLMRKPDMIDVQQWQQFFWQKRPVSLQL